MFEIPKISSRFLCIASRDVPELTAVVSSYVQNEKNYSVFFECPNVLKPKGGASEEFDENYISNTNAEVFSTKLYNAIQRVGGFEHVIYIGLTDEQKSFIDHIDPSLIIEIGDISEVDDLLRGYCAKVEYANCRRDQYLEGLYYSLANDLLLAFDESALDVEITTCSRNGIVVIENEDVSISVIAVNYAHAIQADIQIIEVPECNKADIQNRISDWKNGNDASYLELSSFAFKNVEHIDFKSYEYASFFTQHYPYSLILGNVIPMTQVKTLWDCDFFIYNCVVNELVEKFGSSVVFSPLAFGANEETGDVVGNLETNKHTVKKVIGKLATADELDNTIKEFPYEILHICSHGGEISGRRKTLRFRDRDGSKHVVVYDEVVSFAPSPIEEEVGVAVKHIWRSFDGFDWRSTELKEQELPHYVFVDMVEAARKNRGKGVEVKNVVGSCSISCVDFAYQAMFNFIAGHICYPIVFNNTCWSSTNVSESFIVNGASGYVGTLWSINNNTAKEMAESFYQLAFDMPICVALNKCLSIASGGPDSNVYVYWGLHFSTLQRGDSVLRSRIRITRNLLKGYQYRARKSKSYNGKVAKNNQRIMNWIWYQLETNYRLEKRFIENI